MIVKIRSCGICQTDYKAWSGERTNVQYPIILGHEPSGIVWKVGSAVQGITEGDEIVVSPAMYCGDGITTEGDYSIQPGDLHFLETEIKSSFSITPYAMQKSVDLQERGVINLEPTRPY